FASQFASAARGAAPAYRWCGKRCTLIDSSPAWRNRWKSFLPAYGSKAPSRALSSVRKLRASSSGRRVEPPNPRQHRLRRADRGASGHSHSAAIGSGGPECGDCKILDAAVTRATKHCGNNGIDNRGVACCRGTIGVLREVPSSESPLSVRVLLG